ncbi:hypothetical protein [Massilia sp. TWP1-3-3]|uniref:hypothetical protein n=1 Tax=Massilia sp. TWP1-3-3 TaxID=2804573 RepID=UPI003CF2D092
MPLAPARVHLAPYLGFALIVALTAFGPIAQTANYHDFADQRTLFGLANAGDVLSNLGFLLVAMVGFAALRRARRDDPARLAYAVFFGAIGATALGSTWYHMAPDNARLVWDRLPIALACAALLAAAVRDAYPNTKTQLPLLVLTGLGALSVFWWSWSGDLRFYLLIQAAPLVLIPVLQWQSGAPMAQRTFFFVAIGLYVWAKLFEVADQAVFQALGFVSGHTLKHLLAVAAAFVLAFAFARRR